jgi:hypothetical protein
MSFVRPDIIEGNGGRFTIKGWEFARIFTVEDLTSVGHAMMVEAVVALNIPIGTSHPTVPQALAIEFNPESIPSTGNAARVTVLYREFSQDYRTEIGNRKLMVPRTEYEFNPGTKIPMTTYYKYPADYELNTKLRNITIGAGVKVEVQEYFSTIIITRTEFTTIQADTLAGHAVGIKLTGEILTDRSINYNGKLNKANWNLRPNDPAEVWQCEITASSAEDGLAYRVRYAFAADPENLWRFPATFKDPYTGEPVEVVDRPSDKPTPLPDDWAANDLMTQNNFDLFKIQDFTLLELF